MNTEFLTTGQAAKLCSVTPDTVLKWIRAGQLSAHRTAGGHHRIRRDALNDLIGEPAAAPTHASTTQTQESASAVRYCWEFNSNGELRDGCRECIVYELRAHRCYEVAKLAPEGGHTKLFCKGTCEECGYFQQVHQQNTNVLVVTDNDALSEFLREEAKGAPYGLEVTHCEYACSALVETFRPDYVLIDCSLGEEASRDITNHLLADPRIPFVKVIMASDDGKLPAGCDKQVFAHIRKPLGPGDVGQCIDGRGSKGQTTGEKTVPRGNLAATG